MSRFVDESAAALGVGGVNGAALAELEPRLARLVPFVGAGLSVAYGYPGWVRFLQELAQRCPDPGGILDHLHGRRYEEAAEAAHLALGREMDVAIRRRFGPETLARPLRGGIAAYLPRIADGLVLTTNFDTALEAAYEDAGLPFLSVFAGYQIEEASRAVPLNEHVLLKLHGDHRQPLYRILTGDQYRDAYGADASRVDTALKVPTVLVQALGAAPLLFLGCSLSVDRTTAMLEETARRYPGARHFAVLSADEDSPARGAQLQRWNVLPLYFAAGEFARIERFLECLAMHVEPTRRAPPVVRPRRAGFFGRTEDVERLLRLLRQGERLVTITGAPGSGKTRLADEVCNLAESGFRDGVLVLALDSLGHADEVLPHVVDRLRSLAPTTQTTEDGAADLHAAARRFLHRRRLLLLLDNFEHVRDAALDVLALLDGSRGLSVLVTSREPLNVRDEQRFPLEPLALPPEDGPAPDLRTMQGVPALALFEYQRRKASPGFALDASNIEAVLELCLHLDGLPLAIELAARRSPELPVGHLLQRLRQRPRERRQAGRTPGDRQRTMNDAIAWSYDLLGPDEQSLFRRLAIFGGAFEAPAVAQICFVDPLEEPDAEERLDSLSDRKLLEVRVDGGVLRYRMLAPLQAFAADRLLDSGERDALMARFVRYWVDMVRDRQLDRTLALHDVEARAWLACHAAQLRVAIDACIESGDADSGMTLGLALRSWWLGGVHVSEGRQRLERLLALPEPRPEEAFDLTGLDATLAAAEEVHPSAWQLVRERVASWFGRGRGAPGPEPAVTAEEPMPAVRLKDDVVPWLWSPTPLRNEARMLAAMLAQMQNDADGTVGHLRPLLEAARQQFDDRAFEGVVGVASLLPTAHRAALRLDELSEELLRRHLAFGNLAGQAGVLMMKATLALRIGDAEEAAACVGRCQVLPGHATRTQECTACEILLGDIALYRADPRQAMEHFRAAEGLVGQLGAQQQIAQAALALRLSVVQDSFEGAGRGRESAERALAGAQRMFIPILVAHASMRLAALALAERDWPQVEAHLARCEAIYARAGAVASLARALQLRAVLLLRTQRSFAGFARALQSFEGMGDTEAVAQCRMSWGDGANEMAMYDEAIQAYQEAQRLFQAAGNAVGAANATLRIANALRDRKDYDDAEKHYKAAVEAYAEARSQGGVSGAWKQRGDMQRQRGLHDEALKSYHQALEAARNAKDSGAEASSQVAIGDVFIDMRR